MKSPDVRDTVSRILDYLNKTKTRCTYGAVADVLGVPLRSVGDHLGECRPEASWVFTYAPIGTRNLPPCNQ